MSEEDNLRAVFHESWWEWYDGEGGSLCKEALHNLLNDMSKRGYDAICPIASQIFNVFSMDVNSINVVFLGQSPYPDGNANGYAFSCAVELSPTLGVMFNELKRSYDVDDSAMPPIDLSTWIGQGVFLTNTYLTCMWGISNSHRHHIGWEEVIRSALHYISEKADKGLVYVAFGQRAREMLMFSKSRGYTYDTDKHKFMFVVHPAAQLHNEHDLLKRFVGNNIFTRVNDTLITLDRSPINWLANE